MAEGINKSDNWINELIFSYDKWTSKQVNK